MRQPDVSQMADRQQVAAQHNEKPFGIWAIPTGSLCGYSARWERRPACKHIKLGRAGESRTLFVQEKIRQGAADVLQGSTGNS